MKSEKLDLMLNKVVEYNNAKKKSHFKAFLYKNQNGYYFKVIEVLSGTDISFNDIIKVNKADVKSVTIAQKPKLMVVSKNSWHYKLLKYILTDSAPTPKDMQNGCPYFWLLIFSMIALPFVLLFKAVEWIVLLIPEFIFWVLKQLVDDWIQGLEDEEAYDLRYNYNSKAKMPKTAKIFFRESDEDFFNYFLSRKYKFTDRRDPNYLEKQKEINDRWEEWRKEIQKKRDEEWQKNEELYQIEREKKIERERKRREAQQRWEEKMKPIYDGFNNIGNWFRDTFTVERGRVNMIVKRTKQFVGLIITLSTLVFTFFAVNSIALVLMIVIDALIAGWMYVVFLLGLGVVVGIFYLLYILISSWGQGIVNNYKRGNKVWYIEPIIYVIWYPIKYVAMSFTFFVVYVIWTPIKFVFYTVLFKSLLKPIGLFLAKLFVGLVKGIGSSSGIFGEYFGASYSDYCPGIEWTDFDEE